MLGEGRHRRQDDMRERSLRESRVEAERMLLATRVALAADGDLLDADKRAAIDAGRGRPAGPAKATTTTISMRAAEALAGPPRPSPPRA